MKVALYARVSKADDSQDTESQLIRLQAYAKERGWEVYDKYVDHASGADVNRPDLDRMMSDAMQRRFSLVVTTKIDRMARSCRNLLNLIEELKGRGLGFECTDQPISTETPTGTLTLQILGAVAEFERQLIRERTKQGLAAARARGKLPGHPVIQIDAGRVRALIAEGKSLRAIAKELGVSHQTVSNRLRKEGVEPLSKTQPE